MALKQTESNEDRDTTNPNHPRQRIVRLLVGLKNALGLAEGRTIGFGDIESLTGRPGGTFASWCDGTRVQQLEFLVAILERLPVRLWQPLLESACRTHPTLQHPKLAHDSVVISHLEELLQQKNGFTVIQGGPEHMRAFLLAALGNSFRQISAGQRPVAGFDLHGAHAWVRVPGITYLSPHTEIQRASAQLIQPPAGALVLLGRVWNNAPHLHAAITRLANDRHVVVADATTFKLEDLARRSRNPVHLLTVAPAREQPEWIRVTIQRA